MSSQKIVQSLTASTVSTSDLNVTGSFVLKGVIIASPKSGTKAVVGAVSPGVIIAPHGPLTDCRIIFPERVTDGQVMFISFTQDCKKCIFSNGNFANKSVLGPVVKAGDSITLFYHGATDKWYKLAGGTSGASTTKLGEDGVKDEGKDEGKDGSA